MKLTKRLLIPALLVWAIFSLVTWLSIHPGQQLIGLRALPPRSQDFLGLAPPSLSPALTALESVSIWGIQRNGQPLAPPAPTVAADEAAIVWKVLGAALRKKERYLLIQIEKNAPVQIKEGEELPDGNTLLKIMAQGYVIKTLDGKKETVLTNP